MYKRLIPAMVLVLVSVASPVVRAEDQSSLMLSDGQIMAIKQNCVDVQSALSRVFSNDVLSRVHLGGEYDAISGKYMAPMNSRVALNKLDGVSLSKTTVDFNTKLDEFRTLYQQYKETMARATSMKCVDQPVTFYDTITLARSHRAAVHDCVVTLNSLAKQYQTQVAELRTKTLSTAKGTS